MKIWMLLLGLVFSAQIRTQQISLPVVIDETQLQFRVKQVDEFMRRFNFDTLYDGSKPVDTVSLDERLKNMYTVFRLENFKSDDGTPNKLMTDFCTYIVKNNLRLEYEDNNWMAEVVCDAKMDGKRHKISLLLQTEHIKDVLYKWVLVDAKADFMDNLSTVSKDSLFISPAEHGIGFITLPSIINLSVSDVNTVFKKDWIPDRLSVFSYLVSSKKLSLLAVDKVIYHWTLGDYSFDVERFEGENSSNQGWLVSKIVLNANK